MSRKTRSRTIVGAFVAHSLEMRTSPAWRHLPDDARRLLDQLEVEHMAHGGAQNGRLICTYADFHRGGLRRSSISLAIRQAVALGFLKVANSGQRSVAQFRNASWYTLTYLHGRGQSPNPTDDWRRIKTEEAAQSMLAEARDAKRYDTKPRKPKARPARGVAKPEK